MQHKNYIWIKFRDDFNVEELSATTISELFAKYGDFHVLKDTKKSCILNFYTIDSDILKKNNTQGMLEHLRDKKVMDELKIEVVCPYNEAPKFVAHDHLE